MLKFINSSLPIEKAVLQAELQTISPKVNFTCPLKSIYNSDAVISVQKRPLKDLHTYQKLSFPIDQAVSNVIIMLYWLILFTIVTSQF